MENFPAAVPAAASGPAQLTQADGCTQSAGAPNRLAASDLWASVPTGGGEGWLSLGHPPREGEATCTLQTFWGHDAIQASLSQDP